MRTQYKYYLLFTFLFVFPSLSYTQSFEEFKKSEQEKLNQFKIQQKKEITKLASEFDAYVRQADKEFIDYLKMEWEEYSSFKGIKVPERPKPIEIPKHNPGKIISNISAKKINALIPNEVSPSIGDIPVLPLIQKTESLNFLKSVKGIDYYGTHLSFEFDDRIASLAIQNINEGAIANWWSQCSNTNYNLLVNQLLDTKNKLSLNDWAYFLLVNKTTEGITNGNSNRARLLAWFLMIRSGYKTKVTFNNNNIYLLFPSASELYGKKFLIINNERYYFMDEITSNTFQTYDFDFQGANRAIDFNIYQPLNIGNDISEKQIHFTYKEKEYSFPVLLNINTLFLLKDYPITELNVFFNATMSEVTKQTLADGLSPYINKMSTEDAINFLLNFVQKSFIYKTDQEQFKKEKFFFPEELFYYAASDCEDRSALFAYLIKQLLQLEVIGLEYQDHVATAVNLTQNVYGDYLLYNDAKYIIADPTYINAPLGLCMPQYKNKEAKVIETKNINYIANLSSSYWELTNQWGGFRGSNLCDAKSDTHGNYYLTGYYTKNVSFGNINWTSETEKRQAFIIKYNKEKEIQWAKNIVTSNISTAFALTLDNTGNPVITGSFNGKLNADGHILTTENNNEDIFIASYSTDGDIMWLKKSGLDTISHDRYLNYVVKIDQNGKSVNTKLYFDNGGYTSNGIFFSDNMFTIIGSINNTTGFNINHLSFNTGTDFNTINYLKEENDALIKKNVNQSIAGLFAAINLIKSSGMIIPGIEAQQALDKYNPGFRKSSGGIYKNIGKISFMMNEDGIISVKTSKDKSVSFDKIKVNSGAKIKITSLQNGNEQIDILSGIEVGKFVVWYKLNFVRMLNTGDMLFDFDNDHTQKTVSMKDDILN